MGREIRTTMRIHKIQKVKTQTKNIEKEIYKLSGKDADGVGNIIISLPQSFDGFKADSVVDIVLTSSQSSLKDFEQKEESKKKKKKPSKKGSIPMP